MKTSLVISDQVFREAKKEAARTGRSVSEVISFWAQIGRETYLKGQARDAGKGDFEPLDLGRPRVDLSSRASWMDELEREG